MGGFFLCFFVIPYGFQSSHDDTQDNSIFIELCSDSQELHIDLMESPYYFRSFFCIMEPRGSYLQVSLSCFPSGFLFCVLLPP